MTQQSLSGPRGVSRRSVVVSGAGLVASSVVARFCPRAYGFQRRGQTVQVFDALKFGAVGDGKALDTAAIQQAIDWAAGSGNRAQVLLRGGRRYLVGTLELKGGIDFHLADDCAACGEHTPRGLPRRPGGFRLRRHDGCGGGWSDHRERSARV